MKIDQINKKLMSDNKENVQEIKKRTGESPDIIIKKLSFVNYTIHVVFNETLCDQTIINKFILEYFVEAPIKSRPENIVKYLNENIPTRKTTKINDFDTLFYNLFSGYTIILIDGQEEAISIETRFMLNSPIQEAKDEYVLKGSKDAFTENYQTNIGQIRRRVKTEKLWLKEVDLGTKSKTKIGIMYINDIASKELVEQVINKIENIEIDAILGSNYIIDTISENKRNVFPNYLSTERPDLVAANLLEGRIAIVIENMQYVVVIPAVFVDFFHSTEDLYQKSINTTYTRIIRVIALLITLLVPAVYIAITTFNQEAIPENLIINFAAQRNGVPFPAIVEAILMIITFEILRETNLRIPSTLGSALSIVGAIVLGDAAVTAGIVSPIMVIVVAITSISGLTVSSSDIINGIRWWRIIFIVLASITGLLGVFLAGILFVVNLASMKSFGIPYLAPLAPFDKDNQGNAIFLSDKRKFFKRNSLTAKKNLYRSKEDN